MIAPLPEIGRCAESARVLPVWGGSAKVSIRGIRSANEDGNNQPLYVD